MRRVVFLLVVGLFLVVLSGSANSLTFAGVNIPNSVRVDNKTLNLNGYGIRYFKLLFIKVKVYLGSLYSDIKTIRSADELINDKGPKVIVMHFLHTVKAKQIRDTFVKDFKHNFKKILGTDAEKKFLALFKKKVKPGDEIKLVFHENGDLCVFYNSELSGCVKGSRLLQKAVLMAYFGPHPYSEDLKEEMLGLKKAEE